MKNNYNPIHLRNRMVKQALELGKGKAEGSKGAARRLLKDLPVPLTQKQRHRLVAAGVTPPG